MYELKGCPQPPKRTRGGNFRKKKFGPKFDRKRAGIGSRGPKFGPKFKRKLAGLGPAGPKLGPRFNRKAAGLGPKGPKFGPRFSRRLAGQSAGGRRFGPRFDKRKAGLGPRVSKAYRRGGIRGRSGGASIFSRIMRRIMAQAGLRRPSIRQMFRQKSSGDGRNHSFTGVKKRNGRTGFAGR